jgi:hypothetical protein
VNIDLEDRLAGLFNRVADTVAVEERPIEPITSAPVGRSRRWLPAVAAAAVVVAGAAGVLALRDRGGEVVTIASHPEDPSGALYVLPGVSADWTIANGTVHTADAMTADGLTVGIATDDGFVDPVAIVVVPAGEIDDPPDDAEEVSESSVRVVAQRGSWELTGTGSQGTEWLITRAMSYIDVTDDGTPSLAAGSPLDVIGTHASGPEDTVYETSFQLIGSNGTILVQTASFDTVLHLGRPGYIETVEPYTIAGLTGWHVSRGGRDGFAWHGFAWMATPNRSVFVSGQAPLETVLAAAESLDIVDEQAWIDSTGCAC